MQSVGESVDKKKILAWWDKIMQAREKVGERAFNFGNKEYAELIIHESDGGPCPSCKSNWKRIDFKNVIATGFYFRPSCDCYFRCPNCDQELYDEQMRGLLKRNKNNDIICPDCKWPLIKGNKKYWGKEWDQWFKDNHSKPWKIWELKKELGMIKELREENAYSCYLQFDGLKR